MQRADWQLHRTLHHTSPVGALPTPQNPMARWCSICIFIGRVKGKWRVGKKFIFTISTAPPPSPPRTPVVLRKFSFPPFSSRAYSRSLSWLSWSSSLGLSIRVFTPWLLQGKRSLLIIFSSPHSSSIQKLNEMKAHGNGKNTGNNRAKTTIIMYRNVLRQRVPNGVIKRAELITHCFRPWDGWKCRRVVLTLSLSLQFFTKVHPSSPRGAHKLLRKRFNRKERC